MTTPSAAQNEAADFLKELWPGKPKAASVQIWDKSTKLTHSFADLDVAARLAHHSGPTTDLYIAAGLSGVTGKPRKTRTAAKDIVGIPGVWADIDINGGPEGKSGAAPDHDTAMALAFELLEPTIIVSSGYGLQAWWLFEDPWIFSIADEREQAHRLSYGFQQSLKAAARARGFSVDSTFDLARLMRLPGTRNHKGGSSVPVERLDHEGPRHQQAAIHAVGEEHMKSAGSMVAQLTGQDIALDLSNPNVPFEKLEELREIDSDFDNIWGRRETNKTKDWSFSQYDLSIANSLVAAGFDNQEIADCIRYHRKRGGDTSGKADRVTYLQRTIGVARNGEKHQERQREREAEREDAIDQLGEIAATPNADVTAEEIIPIFDKVVGGDRKIKELVQEGRDPDNSRFKIVLDDGTEVQLGSVEGLISQQKFRAKYAVVTSHLPRMVKGPKWDDVVQALLRGATINSPHEDTRVARVLGWVEMFCDRRLSTDRDAACESLDPFTEEDLIYVPMGPLHIWLRKVRGERLAEIDLKLMLDEAGFERKTMKYTRRDESSSSRSYFRAPEEIIKGAALIAGLEPVDEEAAGDDR